MKAAVFHELGRPLAIENVAEPQAGPGEIVLKVHYCGVCGSDLHSTHPGVFVVPDGTILGHEFAGEIVESGAPGWKVGEMATALPNNACEECRSLGLGECKDNLGIVCPKNTLTGFHPTAQGAYAEYVKFSAKEAFYKCQYPLTLERLGFHDARVELLDWGDRRGAFTIMATRQIAFAACAALPMTGRYTFHQVFVTTGLYAPA